ncbi:hypothetical protein D1872_131550 [compost metagenome]
MVQNSTVESFKNIKELEEHFKSLSTMKIMVNDRKALFTLRGAIILFVLLVMSIIITILVAIKFSGWLPAIITVLVALLVISLLILSIGLSHSSVVREHPEFASLITKRKFKLSYDANFLFAYRCHEVKTKLESLGFENSDIDSLVEHFLMKSNQIKSRRWWPITLSCLILFPLWSEFVGSQISKGWQMILLLIGISVVLIYIVYIIQTSLKDILLAKATKYDELINVLKTIKML